jgi:hypothetical protein
MIAAVKAIPDHSVDRYPEGRYTAENFPECCGICVIACVNGKPLTPERFVTTSLYIRAYFSKKPAGLLFVTDNTPRPDFTAIGFKLWKKFRNPKTGKTIYTYYALSKDTFAKISHKLAMSKIKKSPYGPV